MEGRKTARNSIKQALHAPCKSLKGFVTLLSRARVTLSISLISRLEFASIACANETCVVNRGNNYCCAPQRSAKRPRSEGSRYSSSPDLSVDKIPARLFQGELTQMPRAPNVEKNEKTDIVIAAEYSGRTLLPGTSVTIHLGSNIATSRPPIAQGR